LRCSTPNKHQARLDCYFLPSILNVQVLI
jgi:hypothetical protein